MLALIPLFIVLPMLGAFLIPLVEKLFKKGSSTLAVIIATASLSLSIFALINRASYPFIYKLGGWAAPVGINLVLDGLSALLLITINFIAFNVIIFSVKYMDKFTSKAAFFALLFLMLTGLSGVVLTGDLFNLYIFLEIASLASYALVAFGGESEEFEASLKYAFMGAFASLTILFGIVLLYCLTGTLNLALLAQIFRTIGINSVSTAGTPAIFLALALFLTGFGIKAAGT
ncbi:MAG: proton-conducting transporter membrane subunit [Candidatus Saganbacteria bacterium]|nr:proton-conducting transporter membrane subunit [Candidatus Saganbacteria bacterium]